MKPTKEQITEFWMQHGFKPYIDKYYYDEPPRTLNGWIRDGEPPERFLPKIDLNNLFKYAVPKLANQGYWFVFTPHTFKGGWIVRTKYSDSLGHKEEVSIHNEDPALALFWAIWEVIKERDEDTIQNKHGDTRH